MFENEFIILSFNFRQIKTVFEFRETAWKRRLTRITVRSLVMNRDVILFRSSVNPLLLGFHCDRVQQERQYNPHYYNYYMGI